MTDHTYTHRPVPGATPSLTAEQRGWIVAALVTFVGVALIAPAVASAAAAARALPHRARRRVRELGSDAAATARRYAPTRPLRR